jgi:hypothetical protein
MELKCRWCGETKPAELMIKRNAILPYSQSNTRCCKQCSSEYQRKRYDEPVIRAKQLRLNAAWRKANPEKQRKYEKQFAIERPNQAKARWRVAHLLRRGHWKKQPCVVCSAKAEAHHDSYAPAHWDTVRWLCKDHHEQWHERLDPVKNSLLEEPIVEVERLRDEANQVQKQITALRDRYRELRGQADAAELAAWNKVMEAAQPLYEDFLRTQGGSAPA